jgi:thymidine phosphorylase
MKLALKRIGIDTYRENIAFLDHDELKKFSVGLHPMDRVEVSSNGRKVLAVLNVAEGSIVPSGSIGLSDSAFAKLGVESGATVDVRPADPPKSLEPLRRKMSGAHLLTEDFVNIVDDIVEGRYSKVELTAFLVAATVNPLNDDEVYSLTRAMIDRGEQLRFDGSIIADKHSIGGVPGNRTTPIVVSIAAASGLVIPNTSSRAVTSPSGTADAVETLMDVELSVKHIIELTVSEKGCLVWGGALNLAPADDLIIQVEHPLSIDSESFMIASILAKKKAAGTTHVLLEVPTGSGSKAETTEKAVRLEQRFRQIGARLGLNIQVVITDGSQPIGNGIGPVLEAKDVLKVLRNESDAPADLKERSLYLSGELLELTGQAPRGRGRNRAENLLQSGEAYEKFERIRSLQGRKELDPLGTNVKEIRANRGGRVNTVHNRIIARTARLAGAPRNPGAGIYLMKHVGDSVDEGELLLRIHSESEDALLFAVRYWEEHAQGIEIAQS